MEIGKARRRTFIETHFMNQYIYVSPLLHRIRASSESCVVTFSKRTHTCGALRASDVGTSVTLNGWVATRRDLGGVIFVDLRDRYGITQVVFNPTRDEAVHALAKELRTEYVVSVTGVVERRPDGTVNPSLPTGEVDVVARSLVLVNKSDTPPFPIDDSVNANEEIRLKYRYLDLRRPVLQRNLLMRHAMYQIVRRYFDAQQFVEIETPVLMKSTPEGARDYLVPSRIHRGKFYALPQSPQTYKQILMVSGFDRYIQIVKCFRDEDQRADRQMEFTQIDVEMSFVNEDDIVSLTEGLMKELFAQVRGKPLSLPLKRMTYREAMETYGSDKPDTRFGLAFHCVNEKVRNAPFRVFADAVRSGGVVAGFVVPEGAALTRNQLDTLVDFTKEQGAGGLVFAKWTDTGIESPVEKFLGADLLRTIMTEMGAKAGDLLLLVSDRWEKAYPILGALRLEIARRLNLIDESRDELLWVTEFPLLEYSEEEKRFVAVHHPFTSPHPDDIHLLETDPLKARARAYDLVWNGFEIGGGSIRIHDAALQKKVFSLLGIGEEEAARKFGFLLNAFRFGAPPHGGIALGFDRLAMIMAGMKSIRDVIAFPKTANAVSLMDESPNEVDDKQLRELHIRIV